ncbi:MAG: GNAT family N-acetyltransferase [Anaerolineae bacterium]
MSTSISISDGGGHGGAPGSLLILWGDVAEVRSLVVDSGRQGRGVGRAIARALLAEARTLKIPTVFALTRRAGFFLRLGFQLTEKEQLPRKVMKDCVFCPIFHACDEVGVSISVAEWATRNAITTPTA